MTPEERIGYLEEAIEKLAEQFDTLAWLHAEHRYRLQAMMLKVALSQPEAVDKLQQITELVTAAKAAHAQQSNGA